MAKTKPKYYTLEPIKKIDAAYNIIFGERGPGKTYSLLNEFVSQYWEARKQKKLRQVAYVRRYDDSVKGEIAKGVCTTLLCNGDGENVVPKLTDGVYDNIVFKDRGWWLCKTDPTTGLLNVDSNPFMIGFALNTWRKAKGSERPFVSDIWLEEFVEDEGGRYLKDEIVGFKQLISTIARKRHVKIWMTGNALSLHCPYWDWMGLYRVRDQKPGTIDVYQIPHFKDRKIAVEFTKPAEKYTDSKESNAYLYLFDDKASGTLVGGGWDVGDYPLHEHDITVRDICGRFFVLYHDRIYEGDVVSTEDEQYILVHQHLDPLDPIDYDYDLIYSLERSSKPNYRRRIDRGLTKAEKSIYTLFLAEKIFYDSNLTGNAIENFIKQSGVIRI